MKKISCILASLVLNICITDLSHLNAMETTADDIFNIMEQTKAKFKDPEFKPSPKEGHEILEYSLGLLESGNPVKMMEAYTTLSSGKLNGPIDKYPKFAEILEVIIGGLSTSEDPYVKGFVNTFALSKLVEDPKSDISAKIKEFKLITEKYSPELKEWFYKRAITYIKYGYPNEAIALADEAFTVLPEEFHPKIALIIVKDPYPYSAEHLPDLEKNIELIKQYGTPKQNAKTLVYQLDLYKNLLREEEDIVPKVEELRNKFFAEGYDNLVNPNKALYPYAEILFFNPTAHRNEKKALNIFEKILATEDPKGPIYKNAYNLRLALKTYGEDPAVSKKKNSLTKLLSEKKLPPYDPSKFPETIVEIETAINEYCKRDEDCKGTAELALQVLINGNNHPDSFQPVEKELDFPFEHEEGKTTTLGEVVSGVWEMIKQCPQVEEAKENFIIQLANVIDPDGRIVCQTGKMVRLMQLLEMFYPEKYSVTELSLENVFSDFMQNESFRIDGLDPNDPLRKALDLLFQHTTSKTEEKVDPTPDPFYPWVETKKFSTFNQLTSAEKKIINNWRKYLINQFAVELLKSRYALSKEDKEKIAELVNGYINAEYF